MVPWKITPVGPPMTCPGIPGMVTTRGEVRILPSSAHTMVVAPVGDGRAEGHPQPLLTDQRDFRQDKWVPTFAGQSQAQHPFRSSRWQSL